MSNSSTKFLSHSISRIALILILSLTLISCGGGGGGGNNPQNSTSRELTAFSFSSPSSTGMIDQDAKTVSLTVPFGTDVSALKAVFTTTGVKTTVDDVEQESGVTENNFTGNVTYRVHAEDGSYTDYTVTVKTWAKKFGGTGNDLGYSMCADSSGNIYITGEFSDSVDFGNGSITSNGGADIFIVKYSPDRILQWVRTIGGSGDDISNSICMDSDGNLYIAGDFSETVDFDLNSEQGSVTSTGILDVFLAKFSSDGVYLWVKTIGGTDDDYGISICNDLSGNIYVAGGFSDSVDFDGDGGNDAVVSKGDKDIFFAKYTTGGTYQSVKTIGGAFTDLPLSICTDLSGNIYITGNFAGSSAVDFGGYTLSGSGGLPDVFIVKYSSEMTCQWATKIGGSSVDVGNCIRTDSTGNVYVTGYFRNTVDLGKGSVTSNGNTDIFFVKYDTDGKCLWAYAIGGTGGDYGSSIYLDSSDNVYLAGGFSDTVDFDGSGSIGTIVTNGDCDAFFVKFSSEGIFNWVKPAGVTTGYADFTSIFATSSGKLYATGNFEGSVNFGNGDVTSSGGTDVFLVNILNE